MMTDDLFNKITQDINEKYDKMVTLLQCADLNGLSQENTLVENLFSKIQLDKDYSKILRDKNSYTYSLIIMNRNGNNIRYYHDYLRHIKETLEICEQDYEYTKLSNKNKNNSEPSVAKASSTIKDKDSQNNIFIVYGHDLEFKEAIKDKIHAFNSENEAKNFKKIKPILFDDEFTTGKTIIETLEKQTKKCNYAVILLTADDLGHSKKSNEPRNRARQNVILEWGWFVGTVGRENVLVLVDEDDNLELPSDVLGLKWSNKKTWRAELEKFLKQISNKND